jgi:hypothetical protein
MPISQINSNSLATGVPASANMPTGSLLQVVQAVSNTQTIATTTYIDATGLSVSITPKFATSKIFVSSFIQGFITNTGFGIQLLRSGSVIFNPSPADGTGPFLVYGVSGGSFPTTLQYLDSPATTSAITYNIQFRAYSGSAYINIVGATATGKSTITVMEIAG